MKDQAGTKQELIKENSALKRKIKELENAETERKRAEEALRESETKYRIITEKLNQVQKLKSIGALASGIAHDFNNLLMGIQGNTSLTLQGKDPSHPDYERLKRIEEQVQSGIDLARQLPGFASGGNYEVRPTDMNDLIHIPASKMKMVKAKTATSTIPRGTETILLVDDEEMVLEVSKELLESLGYRVYAAGSGQEALAVYMEKQKEIDLVILDMVMPGISGGETFDRLREINSEIKVLLSSGYSVDGHAREILTRGCNGFIQKPFRLNQFAQIVRDILDKKRIFKKRLTGFNDVL